MLVRHIATSAGFMVLAGTMLLSSAQPVQALTMKECSAKYQAAKAAGTLGGQTWRDFRKAQFGPDATAAVPAAAPPTAAPPTAAPPTTAPRTAAPATAPRARWKRSVSNRHLAKIFERVGWKGEEAHLPR
jgi:hypothetical protein